MRYLFVLLLIVGCARPYGGNCDDIDGLDITSNYAPDDDNLGPNAELGILISNDSRIPDNYTGMAFECENGKILSVGSYKYGKADGVERRWHENGQLAYESNWKDGKAEGVHRWWFDDGSISREERYKDSKRNGVFREWYYNGQLMEETNYKDGKLDGVWKKWYENGQLLMEESIKDGKPIDGKIVYYYEDGAIKGTAYWKNGERVGCEGDCWDG